MLKSLVSLWSRVVPVKRHSRTLEALAVHNRRTALVILLLGDPHLLESGERSQDGATNPDGVFALGGSDDLDFHGRGSESRNLLLHAVGDTGVHGGTTRLKSQISICLLFVRRFDTHHNNVAIKILSYINIALHDRVERGDVNSTALKT